MTCDILAYIRCVQQLYCDYSQQVEEFMDMLHQTIRWRKSPHWNLIIEIQMSAYPLQTFKSPGEETHYA